MPSYQQLIEVRFAHFTTAERDAEWPDPPNDLVIYNTTTEQIEIYLNGEWHGLLDTYGTVRIGATDSTFMLIPTVGMPTIGFDTNDYWAFSTSLNKWVLVIGSVTKFSIDGSNAVLAVPLAMGSNKITGLTAGSASGEAVEYDQLSHTVASHSDTTATGAETETLTDGSDADSLHKHDKDRVTVIEFVIDGGGAAITTGVKGDLWVPFACTVNAWRLLADQDGAIVVDVWNKADGAGNYPPANGEAMPGGGKEPTISASDDYAEDDDVTDWASTSIAAESTLRFNVDSCTTIQRCTLALKVTKT